MTVTELIANFRSALVGLLPAVERVGIPWGRIDAYDDWDKLATSAYEVLVEGVARAAVLTDEEQEFKLPPYDLLLESYAGLC